MTPASLASCTEGSPAIRARSLTIAPTESHRQYRSCHSTSPANSASRIIVASSWTTVQYSLRNVIRRAATPKRADFGAECRERLDRAQCVRCCAKYECPLSVAMLYTVLDADIIFDIQIHPKSLDSKNTAELELGVGTRLETCNLACWQRSSALLTHEKL